MVTAAVVPKAPPITTQSTHTRSTKASRTKSATASNETGTGGIEGEGNETRLCHDVGATTRKDSRVFRSSFVVV